MKKKLFSLLTFALLGSATVQAANITATSGTWPDANCLVLDNAVTQKGSISFTANKSDGKSISYANCVVSFNGNSFAKGLKMETATQILFTTTETATITIVQGLADTGSSRGKVGINVNGTNVCKRTDFDGMVFRTYSSNANAESVFILNPTPNTTDNSEVRVYRFYNVPAGNYTIKKGPECQTILAYVGVTYETTTKNTIATDMDNAGESTVSGAGSYWPNDSLTLTANPVAKAFSKWVKSTDLSEYTDNPLYAYADANATYTAHFIDATTYTIIGAIAEGQESYGTITNVGVNEVAEGNTITLTATPNDGFTFVNWTKGGSVYSTDASITITSSETNEGTYTANFRALYTVTFDAGYGSFGTQTENKLTTTYYADGNNNITTWKHGYAAYDGYTQIGWSDGVNTYGFNTSVKLEGNTTLTAVYEANAASLNLSVATTTVTWSLNNNDSPEIEVNGKTGYYVEQATVNGKTIDIPMLIDATGDKAKYYNIGRSSNTQINANTTLTIPAVKGMVITINCSEKNVMTAENTLVSGEATTIDSEDNTKATYTYTGTASTVTIQLNGGRYYSSIVAVYPKTHTYIDVTSAGYRTFASSSALDFSSAIDGLKAYKAVATGSTIKFEEIDAAVPAATGMLIKAAEGRYYIPLAAGTPAAIDNALVGVTAATEKEAGIFVLMNGAKGLGFYKTTAAFTVGANTAYLPADVAGARTFIGFNDDETTGIESVNIEHSTMNAEHYYDLQGRRVAQPTKGLYILNGKKVFVN